MGPNDVAAYWNTQASTFDDAPDHGLADPATRAAWTAALLAVLPPEPAQIADVGCGTGTLAALLAGLGHHVIGVDLAAAMVGRARSKAESAGVRARFAVADAMALTCGPGTLDVVLARHVLWALPDPAAGLRGWLAPLRPTGRLVLIEGRWHTGAGIGSAAAVELVEARGRHASVVPLDDPALWGGPISDERYLLVSAPHAGTGG